MAREKEKMLELINVKKIYTTKAGDVAALDGVSIRFPEKGMVFVTGKSGSGKTTLLNIIGGLDGIDEGEIEVYGKKFSEFSQGEYDSYRNTLIGFIFQEYNLLPDYSIEKNVGMANELQGVKTEPKAVEDILASVDITSYKGRNPSQLSGGQKQRIAIARALIKNPKIIMADEPTGALDSVTGIQVIEELKRLSKEKLVIVISHDLELANKYADRIIRLVDGKVVEDVTVEERLFDTNVVENDGVVTVKSGSDLAGEDAKVVLNAIKEKKKIKISDSKTIQIKHPTDEKSLVKSDESVKFIKSKMKFGSAAMLGIKSLKVKPLRLIFTILLSAVAFAVFGLFDAVACYERERAMSDLLQSGTYEHLTVSSEYVSETGGMYRMNLSQDYLDQLNKESGYDFRPIYNIRDFVTEDYSAVKSDNGYPVTNLSNKALPAEMKGRGYYYGEVSGVIEFREDEIDDEYNITSYGYECIAGDYPDLSGTIDSTPGYTEVAISKYMADTLKHYVKDDANYFGKRLSDDDYYQDLIGVKFKPGNLNMASTTPKFIITGIYDCGEIPAKYAVLKDSYVQSKDDPNKTLLEELYAYLSSGVQKLVMVAEGEIEHSIRYFGKPVAYQDEPAEHFIEDFSSGYTNSMESNFFCNKSVSIDNIVMFSSLEPYTKDADGVDVYKDELGNDMYFLGGGKFGYLRKDANGEPLLDGEGKRVYDEKTSYVLKENEVLLNATDIKLIFEKELSQFSRYDEELNDFVDITDPSHKPYASYLSEDVDAIFQAGIREEIGTLRAKLLSAFKIANTHLTPVSHADRYKNGRTPDLTRDIVLQRKVTATGKTYNTELKIVGVYFGLQDTTTSFDVNYEPIVCSETTLANIGINTDQGYYPQAISLVNTNEESSDIVAERLSRKKGITLVWYGSTVMSTLAKNETFVNQFVEIFLYASIVLAIFSMFMLFNYISASIVSKRSSIGVLRALGSNSGDVFKMFITESVIIALINGVLASLTAWFACSLVNAYLINVMHFIVKFALFGVRQIAVIFAISLVAAIISSIVPIIKIAREKPVDLIRRP
ncbi:MAG: ATP-binding cassette domain-containing protein [Clostridia bacterium]|nr:ATP-binding cassette domain-containing protein [Clostridia bacterium]